ncbi:gag-pol polyprotein [Tanacetum coccineum]
MSHLLAQFISLNLNSSKSVMAANGDSMPLASIGSVDTPYVALSDVYCILSLTMNLPSISKVCDYEHFRDIHASSGVDLSSFLFDYSSSTFYLRTLYQTSCTDTPQQNGVAKRKHRHLVETTGSFLLPADVPSVFWGEAVLTTTYVINTISTAHKSSLSPFEKLYGTLSDYSSLHSIYEHVSCTKAVCDPLWQGALVEETKSNGSIERYKARLVAKGYSQEYGMDTFALVAKMTTVQTSIAVASSCEVCKLHKALYGLKQAPRTWYEKFSTVVTRLRFVSSHHDSALLSDGHILLSLYVDNMIITGDDCDGIKLLKAELSHRFAMKDWGLLYYFLGIEVASLPKSYLLFQSKYILDLFDHARWESGLSHSGSSYVVYIVSQFVGAPIIVHGDAIL